MLGHAGDLNILLDGVCAQRSAAGANILAGLAEAPRRGGGVLYSCAASWTTRAWPSRDFQNGPLHQTLRRRGKAPEYPRPIDLTRGIPGRLVMLQDSLSLEPLDARKPCVYISAESLQRVSFFADCVEIIHGRNERTLVRCDDIDSLDLKFEAHYGR